MLISDNKHRVTNRNSNGDKETMVENSNRSGQKISERRIDCKLEDNVNMGNHKYQTQVRFVDNETSQIVKES